MLMHMPPVSLKLIKSNSKTIVIAAATGSEQRNDKYHSIQFDNDHPAGLKTP